MKPSVYVETTIPSYLTARPSRDLVVMANQQIAREWWDRRRGAFELFISQFVLDEAAAGDTDAAAARLEMLREIPLLEVDEACRVLGRDLLSNCSAPAQGGNGRAARGSLGRKRHGLSAYLELQALGQRRVAISHRISVQGGRSSAARDLYAAGLTGGLNAMSSDPIVDEVRRAREEYAQKFDYDLDAISRDVQRRQAAHGTRVVRRNPRPVQPPRAALSNQVQTVAE